MRQPRDQNKSTTHAFANLAWRWSYASRPFETLPLRNVTFWAGAGFSKAWDPTAPIGKDLFTIDAKHKDIRNTLALESNLLGLYDLEIINPDHLKRAVYFLDMYKKYPDIRGRYFDDQNIDRLRSSIRAMILRNFELKCSLAYWDAKTEKFPVKAWSRAQRDISSFFGLLNQQSEGSTGIAMGLRYHFITTNYDYVIERILDGCLGEDDSPFLYLYRGVTAETVANQSNRVLIHNHWLVQHLIKLNGGFEILRSPAGYILNYLERKRTDVEKDPPVVMLPSREQDYTDPYFLAVFPKAVRLMRESHALVIVGYALPEEDALIRFIIRQFAEGPEDAVGKHLFYVDLSRSADMARRLEEVFPFVTDQDVLQIHLYQGNFAEFAREATLRFRQIQTKSIPPKLRSGTRSKSVREK